MSNPPAQQAQIVPYGLDSKPRFCLLFLKPAGEHWPTILQMREHIRVQEDSGREDMAGHAEATGYLFCPLYNPMCFNVPLPTERFQPQAG